MDLFQEVDFISHAGIPMSWKIEMDALSEAEWDACAKMIMEYQKGPFCRAEGIPRGGVPLGKALNKYASGNLSDPVLIVDDVYTTGTSFREYIAEHYADEHVIQWCVFARKQTSNGVKALFTMP